MKTCFPPPRLFHKAQEFYTGKDYNTHSLSLNSLSPPQITSPTLPPPSASSPPPLPRPPASPRNPPAAAATADRVKKINTIKEFTAALAAAKDRLVVVEFATIVKMVAKLDEPEEQNYVRKHARQQAEELGVSMREAATRIFSNASGSYSSNIRDCEIGYED